MEEEACSVGGRWAMTAERWSLERRQPLWGTIMAATEVRPAELVDDKQGQPRGRIRRPESREPRARGAETAPTELTARE